jgi:hypothetical protein
MFAFGEGAAKRTLAGGIFGVGMAVGAVNFMAWLFPWRSALPNVTALTHREACPLGKDEKPQA